MPFACLLCLLLLFVWLYVFAALCLVCHTCAPDVFTLYTSLSPLKLIIL